jgi:microcystin-dependent protein
VEEYIGIVKLFGGNFAPQGWAFCDGALLSINQNSALFALLGNQFGGDGISTFSLPNLKPILSVNEAPVQYIICLTGMFPIRE